MTGLNVRTRSTNMDTGTQDAEFRFREWAGSTGFVLRINYAVPEEPERAYCPISGNQHRPEPSGRSQGHINPRGTVAHAKKMQLPALPSLPTPCPTCACSPPTTAAAPPLPCPLPQAPCAYSPPPLPTRRRPQRVMQDSLRESGYGVTYGRSKPFDYDPVSCPLQRCLRGSLPCYAAQGLCLPSMPCRTTKEAGRCNTGGAAHGSEIDARSG